jgi:hypothetical protein
MRPWQLQALDSWTDYMGGLRSVTPTKQKDINKSERYVDGDVVEFWHFVWVTMTGRFNIEGADNT